MLVSLPKEFDKTVRLKSELEHAREKLRQAWAEHNTTDALVLKASAEFDRVLIAYYNMLKVGK